MTATVQASLDQSLPLYRRTLTKDIYGNDVETYPGTPTFALACNIYAPSAQLLTVYADVIGGRRALMLRYMPAQDVHEGDRVVYQGLNWRVQPVETAESYTFTNDVMITAIT
jgi:hypothetical protein